MSKLLKIQFSLTEEHADDCQLYLGEKVGHGWQEVPQDDDSIEYTIHLEDHPLGEKIVEEIQTKWPHSGCTAEDIEEENWGLAWKDYFEPIICGGKFEVLPPWYMDRKTEGMIHIQIEPKMAFGTGSHPTTALCLELISKLDNEKKLSPEMKFFDLGTGSAILAIALAKLGLHGDGVDIDPQSIVCARENLHDNDVENMVKLTVGSSDCIKPELKYELVVANILSGPLIELSTPVVSRLKNNSTLILSGILKEQVESVSKAYTDLGLAKPEIFTQGEWAALLFENITMK